MICHGVLENFLIACHLLKRLQEGVGVPELGRVLSIWYQSVIDKCKLVEGAKVKTCRHNIFVRSLGSLLHLLDSNGFFDKNDAVVGVIPFVVFDRQASILNVVLRHKRLHGMPKIELRSTAVWGPDRTHLVWSARYPSGFADGISSLQVKNRFLGF